jgi:hypothetical protein
MNKAHLKRQKNQDVKNKVDTYISNLGFFQSTYLN